MTLFFYHIPKTAGTSFKRALEHWRPTRRDADISAEEREYLNTSIGQPLCIHGHFGARLTGGPDALLSRYPAIISNPNAQVITLFREPLDHAISVYHHRVRQGKVKTSLTDFLSQPHTFAYSKVLEISKVSQISEALSSFWFVGTTESLDHTIARLASMLGEAPLPAEALNVRTGSQPAEALPAYAVRRAQQMLALDYEIYEYVQDLVRSGESHWNAPRQFEYLKAENRLACESPRPAEFQHDSRVRLARVHAHDAAKTPSAMYGADQKIGISVEFESLEHIEGLEPALLVRKDGAIAFSAAFIDSSGHAASGFGPGMHKVTFWIPPHFLNLGMYEIDASLNVPYPVQKLAKTVDGLRIEVLEASEAALSSRGNWRTSFPGPIRPRLECDIEF
jgi:hypothetical protein